MKVLAFTPVIVVVLAVVWLFFPLYSTPSIGSEYHWKRQEFGFAIYDNNGIKMASFRRGYSCIFSSPTGYIGCNEFEDDSKALAWMAAYYKDSK